MSTQTVNSAVSAYNEADKSVQSLIESKKTEEKFVSIFAAMHGDKATGQGQYVAERFNFLKMLQEDPKIAGCSKLSLVGCFLDGAVNGLSFDRTRNLAYVISRNIKKADGSFERRAYLTPTPYGELYLRQKFGQIKHADYPIVVYEGDEFKPRIEKGIKVVDYAPAIPRKSNKIIAGFMRIVRSDGMVEFFWMLVEEMERLAKYSARNNAKWITDPETGRKVKVDGDPNELYNKDGQIEPGFFCAKIIKFAFKNYPKAPLHPQAKHSVIVDDEPPALPAPDGTTSITVINDIPENYDQFEEIPAEEEQQPSQAIPEPPKGNLF